MKEFLSKLLIPIWYVLLFVMMAIDMTAHLLDHVFGTHFRKPKISVEEVEFLVASNLSIGASSQEILTFLNSFNIPIVPYQNKVFHDFIRDLELFEQQFDRAENQSLKEKKHLIRQYAHVWIENVGKELTSSEWIGITFYVDERANLVDYEVKRSFTGL